MSGRKSPSGSSSGVTHGIAGLGVEPHDDERRGRLVVRSSRPNGVSVTGNLLAGGEQLLRRADASHRERARVERERADGRGSRGRSRR